MHIHNFNHLIEIIAYLILPLFKLNAFQGNNSFLHPCIHMHSVFLSPIRTYEVHIRVREYTIERSNGASVNDTPVVPTVVSLGEGNPQAAADLAAASAIGVRKRYTVIAVISAFGYPWGRYLRQPPGSFLAFSSAAH